MTEITIKNLARKLSDFGNLGTWPDEGLLIKQEGHPAASLSPILSGIRVGDLGKVLSELPPLLPDEIDAFEDDLKAIRKDHQR